MVKLISRRRAVIIVIIGIVILLSIFFISSTPSFKGKEVVIKGIGLKDGAWSKYRLEPTAEEMIVKTFSFKIDNEDFLGIETELSFGASLVLFEKDGENQIYVSKLKNLEWAICLPNLTSEFSIGYQGDEKWRLKEEYKVNETLNFVGREKVKLESGKEIEVLKFKRKSLVVGDVELKDEEYWFSGQVPGYLVYYAGKIKSREAPEWSGKLRLIDFGLQGAKSLFSKEDLKRCKSGGQSITLPQLNESLWQDRLSCQTDSDCACGIDKETRICAFGNKAFIDASELCLDFCSGLQLKCVDNLCEGKWKSE